MACDKKREPQSINYFYYGEKETKQLSNSYSGPVAKKQGHIHNSNLIFAEDHLIDVDSFYIPFCINNTSIEFFDYVD